MRYLGKGKYIIVIISDKYLKSPNCMFELLQIAENGNFYDRIFPIIMADAKIFKATDRLDYVHFWENETSELEEKIKQSRLTNLQGVIGDDLNLYSEIRRNIAQLVGILKNINTLTVKMHRESNYEEVYDAISGKIEEDKHASATENVNVSISWRKAPPGDRKKDIEGHLSREYEMLSRFETKRDLFQQRMEDVKDALSQVNAPLKLLKGHSINIISGIVPKEKVREKLFHIYILAKMASNYAENFQRIVDLDKGAKDNIKLDKEIIYDLKKYLIGLAIDFQPLSRMKFIHVCVIDTSDNLSLEVDKDLFDQAMMNIIENALQYSFKPEERNKIGLKGKPVTPKDKENVLIKAKETNSDIVITISNYGIEISGKEREEIFKRNFRGREASDRITLGTGSGLFLAKEIIKLHNGDIELVSGTPKYNTVFRITLPKGRAGKKEKSGRYS